jgi:hypothetical protein
MLAAFVAASAFAAPDPWRIRVTDLDPNAPTQPAGTELRFYHVTREDNFGPAGGDLQIHAGDYGGGPFWNVWTSANYNAATGALSYGTASAPSIEGVGDGTVTQGLKVGSVYKGWVRKLNAWTGHSIQYTTSSDGVNWAALTVSTIYGPKIDSTDGYGYLGAYRSTGGVYLVQHGNSFAAYQMAHGKGVMTSGVGETVWYDIDTGSPDATDPYNCGDPIADPHTAGQWYHDTENYGSIARVCDGNLVNGTGAMENHNPNWATQTYKGRGIGLFLGTAGELCGGDDYVWIADPDNANTESIGDSVISAIGLSGLSGPSLHAYMYPSTWRSWYAHPIGLVNNQTDPSAAFVMLYFAAWDTDSSDGEADIMGVGRAKLWLTRNKADLNYDGTVNFQDIGPFSGAYGSSSGQPLYNPDADFNGDGKVDFQDIGPLSGRYGSDCTYSSP